MMKILVTGASGFLGSWACRTLSKNHQVTALIRENSSIFNLSYSNSIEIVRSPSSNWKYFIKDINPDVILILDWHGVSNSMRNSEMQNLNVSNFKDLLRAAVEAKIWKVIGFGSQAELGPVSNNISDDQIDNPTSIYGKAKVECRNFGLSVTKNTNTDFIWLRIFSTYGPLDNESWLIPSAILTLNDYKIFNATLGEQTWSFLHVYDFTTALNFLINTDYKQKVFNLGDTNTFKVKEVLISIQDLMNRKNLLDFGAIPYRTDQIMRLEPRCEGLKKLGWYPLIPLHNGLVQTINWFTNKTEIPLQTKLNTSMYFNLPERIKSLNN